MKVIKDGRSENLPKQISCHYCASSLEVEPSDIIHKHYDQRDGNSFEFKCGVCGRAIFVDMSILGWKGV